MNFKFEKGQKVIVNPLVSQEYWQKHDPANSCSFIENGMGKFRGKIVTIAGCFNGAWSDKEKEYYRIIEDGYCYSWRDSSFIPLEQDLKILNSLLLNGGIDIDMYNKVKQNI